MDKSKLRNNIWKIEKRSAESYNDFDEYFIKNKNGDIISKIPNSRVIADKIVESHNEIIMDLLCEID